MCLFHRLYSYCMRKRKMQVWLTSFSSSLEISVYSSSAKVCLKGECNPFKAFFKKSHPWKTVWKNERKLMLWVKATALCQTLCKHLGYLPGIILLSWSFKYLMGFQRLLFHVPGQTFRSFIKLWKSKFSPGNKEASHNHGVINGKNLL